jgi:hypothetical protein
MSFTYSERIPISKKRNKVVKVRISVAPGYEKTLSKVYVCFLDITDLHKAERKLKLYMGHLEDLVTERTSQLSLEISKRKEAEDVLRDLYSKELFLRQKLENISSKEPILYGV